MPDPLTDADLARLSDLAAHATPGTWRPTQDEMGSPLIVCNGHSLLRGTIYAAQADVDFACAAQDTLPRLVAELRAARAELAACREALRPFAEYAGAFDGYNPPLDDEDILEAEWIPFSPKAQEPTLGDCRRAAALLTRLEGASRAAAASPPSAAPPAPG